MKTLPLRSLFCLAGWLALAVCGCQTAVPVADPAPPLSSPAGANALTAVLAQKERGGRACARVVIDQERIAGVQLHGRRYLAALREMDIRGCPEKFRLAWADYLAAWERKLNQERATEDTLDAVSMWKGGLDDLPATLRCIEPYDTLEAWRQCERAAAECGVAAVSLSRP
jgi:hypothetical protein